MLIGDFCVNYAFRSAVRSLSCRLKPSEDIFRRYLLLLLCQLFLSEGKGRFEQMQRATTILLGSLQLLRTPSSLNLQTPSRWTGRCWSSNYAGLVDRQNRDSDCRTVERNVKRQWRNESMVPAEAEEGRKALDYPRQVEIQVSKKRIGDRISLVDKNKFLIDILLALDDSKESVYGALDAWLAWERDFPVVGLKRALLSLQKDGHWHRIVQVLKWMLSKGQGKTMGTYELLIMALDKDQRAEEAHSIWTRKISYDLRSVPWRICDLMISIYYRNNMLERLIKLFKGLEAFERKPPQKSTVRKVSDAYEMLGSLEEKEQILEKYKYLFDKSLHRHSRKSGKKSKMSEKNAGKMESESSEASLDRPLSTMPEIVEAGQL